MCELHERDIDRLDGIEGKLFGEVVGVGSDIDAVGVVDLDIGDEEIGLMESKTAR